MIFLLSTNTLACVIAKKLACSQQHTWTEALLVSK